MVDMVLVKNAEGKLVGLTDNHEKAYSKFKRKIADLGVDETIKFSHRFPRSPKFHRLHFKLLALIFDAQERFDRFEDFRNWIKVGAGHCDFIPYETGVVALPKSINYEQMDDAEFSLFHQESVNFLRSTHASRFLWPSVDDRVGLGYVDSVLIKLNI